MPDELVIADPDRWNGSYNDVTRELIELLDDYDDVRTYLEESIKLARKANGDPKKNPVQDLDDYVKFVDRASRLIPHDVLEDPSNLVRDQILQTICYFYFLIDQELPGLEDEGLFNNTIQYYYPFSEWVRTFADSWGAFLGTEDSWNDRIYRQFYADPRFGLQEDWYEPASFWNTFNRFFSRYLESPAARPIDAPNDPSIVTSPADSEPQETFSIDEDSNITVKDDANASANGRLTVKGVHHYNVNDLVGVDSGRFKDAFAGGTLTHTFLNVNDYHRYHFPVSGTVRTTTEISGNAALEVNWNEKEGRYEPVDSTGWQFTQTRGCAIVETDDYGLVGLVPMGMAQVSSITFEDNVQVGNRFEKGDMLGTFLFGGSDFVMLFQEEAGFEPAAPAKAHEHLHMGEKYGTLKG